MNSVKNKINPKITISILLSVTVIIVSFLTWTNFQYVQENQPENSLFHQWLKTRMFIFDGISPYQSYVSESVIDDFGWNQGRDFYDYSTFEYPLYKILLFIPFALFGNFRLAFALWITTQQLLIIALGMVYLRIARWRIKIWLLPLYLVFLLLEFHSMHAVLSGNVVILVTLFTALMLKELRDEKYLSAGFFLACMTIRPKLSFLLVLIVLFWAISRRKWSLVRWFIFSLAGFIAIGMLFIPNWPLEYIRVIIDNEPIISSGSLGNAFLWLLPGIGNQLRWLTLVILFIVLISEWYLVKSKEYRYLLWTFGLTIALSQLIGLTSYIGDVVFLIIPIVLVFSVVDDRYEHWGIYVVLFFMLVILAGTWALAISTTADFGRYPIFSRIHLPLSLFVFTSLYWIRWWAIKPPTRALIFPDSLGK